MKQIQIVLIALVGAVTLIACKNEQGTPNAQHIENSEISSTMNPILEEQENGFQKTLTLQNITFDIKSSGEGSIQQLLIQPKGLEIDNQDISREIDGSVVDAEIEDLNSDGSPEIVIYTVSAGSGSYGNVIGYSVNNGKSMSEIYFPDLFDNKEASTGYMGHDQFTIMESTLARRFPVYKEGDTNNNPTGGTRQIEYKLKDGEASRSFVIDKISEF